VLLAGKIIDDIDKAKPEVVIQVAVMEARRDRMRNVGITPPSSVSTAFVNPVTTTTTSGTTTTPNGTATFSQLLAAPFSNLLPQGYSITLPSATANFLMTDTSTQILDDPEIRVVDGQTAKLRIGDRIPVATGSFQAGIGVGATTGAVNPLVNTQFQYLDVGVNVDVTPRIHPDHEISMKVNVVVSSQTGSTNIGGINQPIISQRSIEHDIRLKDGEVNVLGGLMEQTDTDTITGLPGLARVPGFRYLFGNDNIDHEKDEILIVLIPHIVRMPVISADNLRSIASGTDTNAEVRLADAVLLPEPVKAQAAPAAQPAQPIPAAAAAPAPANTSASTNASLQFEPGTAALKVGETSTIGVTVQNVQDLYSIPMLLQFNPAVISIEDVRQGGFLSGGTQEVAIVERVDKERGQAIISATRMPNTPGVSGSGTLVGIVIKGLAPGNSQLSIVQVNAKDSQQRPIQVVTSEASVRVQ
jgi:general secretion pathway protein D